MAEMENFKKDFVKRTIDVLNKTYNDSEYEVTLLLNCLCGMVTLPIETEKYDQKMEIDLFKEKCVKKLESLCLYSNFYKRSYYNTFIDIRNSMAHFNIEVSN
ncbi:MAG: hypothetical protein HFH31_01795, partial [Bacilli bacterium]|nr:hypothetical protein [Bacilli bacterium]